LITSYRLTQDNHQHFVFGLSVFFGQISQPGDDHQAIDRRLAKGHQRNADNQSNDNGGALSLPASGNDAITSEIY